MQALYGNYLRTTVISLQADVVFITLASTTMVYSTLKHPGFTR